MKTNTYHRVGAFLGILCLVAALASCGKMALVSAEDAENRVKAAEKQAETARQELATANENKEKAIEEAITKTINAEREDFAKKMNEAAEKAKVEQEKLAAQMRELQESVALAQANAKAKELEAANALLAAKQEAANAAAKAQQEAEAAARQREAQETDRVASIESAEVRLREREDRIRASMPKLRLERGGSYVTPGLQDDSAMVGTIKKDNVVWRVLDGKDLKAPDGNHFHALVPKVNVPGKGWQYFRPEAGKTVENAGAIPIVEPDGYTRAVVEVLPSADDGIRPENPNHIRFIRVVGFVKEGPAPSDADLEGTL
jgi:hypothetical protein